jgi:hypothetical protein
MTVAGMCASMGACTSGELDFKQYPSAVISNNEVQLKVYLPDAKKGLYRATRFDWSGVIGSVQYKGHEYFGYWKETHDPMFHEDLTESIKLKNDGFIISHNLKNTGTKAIETDQFNHNFFMIDGEASGPAFNISFPYAIATSDDTKGFLEIKDKELYFIRELVDDNNVFVALSGYGGEAEDHQVTVVNQKSGAGVTFSVDKPLHRMVFWACATTLSPENSIWISVEPGSEESWNSEYTLFTN